MVKRLTAAVLMVVFAANTGRSQDSAEKVKGRLYHISDLGIVAQKTKQGVLVWSRDDVANKRTWRDAKGLALLRLKDNDTLKNRLKKGSELGGGWLKYVGTYRHGNLFTGSRDIPAYEIPDKEEVEQAKYEMMRKEEEEMRNREIERCKAMEQRRFEDEQRRIRENAEREKVERELRRQREENDRKLAEERAKAEIEAAKQREEAARKAEEERKRRYPIEQKERAEYAKVMLSKISFDVNSYFDIQKDLKRFIYSASVTEKKWSNLKDLRLKNDWLGMLNVVSGNEMKDFPDQSQIASIIDRLENTKFHAEFIFTHKKCLLRSVCIGWVDVRECSYAFIHPGHFDEVEQYSGDSNIVTFSMATSKKMKPILYAKGLYSPERKLFDNRSEQLKKINSDSRLGKITQSEAEERKNDVEEKFRREVVAWIETSKVSDAVDVFSERMREGHEDVDMGKKPGAKSSGTKPKWIACPDCEGSRYISKGECEKCGGEGKYRTPVTRGISGRLLGGRMTQCEKCKGKGEIRERCKRCRGNGKIKQ